VPLRSLSATASSEPQFDALPVPLRPAHDYRSERPTSAPPRSPILQVVPSRKERTEPVLRQFPPPGVLPMLSIGPTSHPPLSAAQITLPEQLHAGRAATGSQPPSDSGEQRSPPSEVVRADRSTTNARPIALPLDSVGPVAAPTSSVTTERIDSEPPSIPPVSPPSQPPSNPPSQPPGDSGQMGRLAARAGSTQSAKPISLTGRSPTPASENSAFSQPGEMPLSAMFSMAASRQSLTSQTPQALKLGWVIAGLALAALLLLLTILVLIERSRDSTPLLPPTSSMQ